MILINVSVENPKHSDFIKLRNMLICTHMHDLKDITQDVHYENFRAQCISQISKEAIRERRYNTFKLFRKNFPNFTNNNHRENKLFKNFFFFK